MKAGNESKLIVLSNFIWAISSVFNSVVVFYIPAQFGLDEFTAGAVISIFSSGSILGTISFPFIGNRFKLKKYHHAMSILATIGYGIAGVFYTKMVVVVPAIIITYFGISNITLMSKKLIVEYTTLDNRRKTFGYNYSVMNFARIFIPSLAVLYYEINTDHIRGIFFFAAIMTFLGTVVIFFLPSKSTEEIDTDYINDDNQDVDNNDETIEYSSSKLSGATPVFIAIFGTILLIMQINYLIPKHIEYSMALTVYSLVMFVSSIIKVAIAPITVRLTRNFSEVRIISSGMLFLTVGITVIGGNSKFLVMLGTVIFTIGNVLVLTTIDTFYSKRFTGEAFDKVLVVHKVILQSAKAATSFIFGFIIVKYGFDVSFGVCFAIGIISSLTFYITQNKWFKLNVK